MVWSCLQVVSSTAQLTPKPPWCFLQRVCLHAPQLTRVHLNMLGMDRPHSSLVLLYVWGQQYCDCSQSQARAACQSTWCAGRRNVRQASLWREGSLCGLLRLLCPLLQGGCSTLTSVRHLQDPLSVGIASPGMQYLCLYHIGKAGTRLHRWGTHRCACQLG